MLKECEDLIDSLVYYVRGAIADYKTDDEVRRRPAPEHFSGYLSSIKVCRGVNALAAALKSTENCVCILHNLSYRLEDELPKTNVRVLQESRQNLARRPRAIGCFAHRGTKITEVNWPHDNQHRRYKGCPRAAFQRSLL